MEKNDWSYADVSHCGDKVKSRGLSVKLNENVPYLIILLAFIFKKMCWLFNKSNLMSQQGPLRQWYPCQICDNTSSFVLIQQVRKHFFSAEDSKMGFYFMFGVSGWFWWIIMQSCQPITLYCKTFKLNWLSVFPESFTNLSSTDSNF